MLYNKNWDAKTVTSDPLTLEGLIAWLEKQPAGKEYEFGDCEGACLLGQYMASVGEPWSGDRYSGIANAMCDRHEGFNFYIGVGHPRNFGGALIRAREVLAAR